MYIIDQRTESTWYGKKTYHNEVKYESRNLHVYTHTVEADRPVSVQFIGDTEGDVDIYSKEDVILRGSVLNPTGTTEITAGDEIVQEGDEAYVTGRRIELTAGEGIGADTAIRTDVGTGLGAGIEAVTTSGAIQITELSGDLAVDRIVTGHDSLGSGDAVTVQAAGAVVTSRTAEGTYDEGLVQGGAITITAGGGVGTDESPITLDSGDLLRDKVTIDAQGDVYITEKTGDLHLKGITADGDVNIGVVSGGIVDAEESEIKDERTYAELKAGVWHDLALTDTTGAASKVQAAKDTYAANRKQEYQTYWSYRLTQPHNPISSVTTTSLAGTRYYAIVDGTTIRLAASAADALSGKAVDIDAAAATGTGHGLSTAGVGFDVETAVNGTLAPISILDHGFTTGDAVTYSNEGKTGSIGLTMGVTYYVDVVDENTIRLKTALGAPEAVDLTAAALSATHGLYRLQTFDPAAAVDGATDTITLDATHGIKTGDAVYYSAAAGDTAISKVTVTTLTDGGTYYVIRVDADRIQLSATPGGPALDLTSAGALGALHQIYKNVLNAGLFDPATDVDERPIPSTSRATALSTAHPSPTGASSTTPPLPSVCRRSRRPTTAIPLAIRTRT
jgi:hypothetical protein